MTSVIIGIPVYQKKLSFLEEVSLQQVKNILGKYKIVFIAPNGLDCAYMEGYEVVRFSNDFFCSRETYSELLMNEEFYEKFISYKYLLIYQLDAFVFKDELDLFCNMNFDYIGAPLKGGDWGVFHVGNGGLSLRNIRKSLYMAKQKNRIKEKMLKLMDYEYFAEDLFFSYCGYASDLDYKVPTPRLATRFAVQRNYAHGLLRIKKHGLPFGCHYWHKLNYYFWKPYIERFGYKLPVVESDNSILSERTRILNYLYIRYVREKRWENRNDFMFKKLYGIENIKIYGAGKWGRKCILLFDKMKLGNKIRKVYDRKKTTTIGEIPLVEPTCEEVNKKDGYIIIAALKYEEEIDEKLTEWGLERDIDYITLSQLLCDSYALRLW